MRPTLTTLLGTLTRRAATVAATIPIAAALGALLACAEPAPPPATVDLAAFEGGRLQFPGVAWPEPPAPESLGWSAERLEAAGRLFEELDSAALMVVHRGVPVASWGDVGARYNSQSVRKSLLSALLGTEAAAGRLDLGATLADLDIDDQPPLTPEERRATVDHLLRSRSGIYHSALYEAGSWKRGKPARGTDPPGSVWYYNNWDFNALGTIFERAAGIPVHEAFDARIARPLAMQEFRPGDVSYLSRDSLTERVLGNASDHEAYVFMISARDLARFGLLYLAEGRWGDRQIVPADWVAASWHGEPVGEHGGWEADVRYGYMWWIYPKTSWLGGIVGAEVYVARGSRGHRLLVVPELDLVLVHRVATGGVGFFSQLGRRMFGSPEVEGRALAGLLEAVMAAYPDTARPAAGDQKAQVTPASAVLGSPGREPAGRRAAR